MRALEFTVSESEAGVRVDHVLHRRHPDLSRCAVQNWILRECVTVDGRHHKPGYRVRAGQVVLYSVPEPPRSDIVPEAVVLEVVFEDGHIVVLNKPAGMVVHPAGPLRAGTLVNALQHRYGPIAAPGAPDRPGIVHRLDKGTSGLMVVARSEPAYLNMVTQIATRKVSRTYRAIIWGTLLDARGSIDRPIGRSHRDRKKMAVVPEGKPALTSYALRRSWDMASELEVSLHTGRTHQIRVHMSWLGHPVVGDGDYGGRRSAVLGLAPARRAAAQLLLGVIQRPALHAWRLAFTHPVNGGRLEFEANPPEDYQAAVGTLDRLFLPMDGSRGQR
ncbi:RluA family pseudouridine synthase [Candidatus Fermentibacteria bacterium]|nr:RluA family pseudouridine synthase [Candidatus Fermentibacteria bacterium]